MKLNDWEIEEPEEFLAGGGCGTNDYLRKRRWAVNEKLGVALVVKDEDDQISLIKIKDKIKRFEEKCA